MASGEGEGGGLSLEFTPTWIIAIVCFVIVSISLFFERFLHYLGKALKKTEQNYTLFEALTKVKEELMLLGFISLLLTVLQNSIQKICIPDSLTRHGLPCKKDASTVSHFVSVQHFKLRALLASESSSHCKNGQVPLLSLEAIHQLHIFIFVLAITHVVFSLITVVLGFYQMKKWKHWEAKIQREDNTAAEMVRHVQDLKFIKDHFKEHEIISWLHSLVKQFYGAVTIDDYRTLRFGFIVEHCKRNPKFDFYKYMIRALEADFKKIVGISWYLWLFVIVFLILNVAGWHTYFWISLIPFILLFIVGGKMVHIIGDLAKEVAEKHTAIEGDLQVTPSDELFWFKSPKSVLFLIHFILFQNAFEIAYFFWILTTYGFHSCIMDQTGYIVARLIISVIVQVVCSYITLPLYAIVSHMGSRYNKAIFPRYVQEGLDDLLERIRNNPPKEKTTNGGGGGNNLWRRIRVKKDINQGENNNGNYVIVQTQPEVEIHDIRQESEIEEMIEMPAQAKEGNSSNQPSNGE
ncbi:hypothetical protein LUZ60_004395 [Juncus effusus]|nr:hypothetical protein LUZ60_004395 [Juncus effusus]